MFVSGAGAFAMGPDDAVIRMRGLPFTATPDDIVRVRVHGGQCADVRANAHRHPPSCSSS
jgi:hypothetical protein